MGSGTRADDARRMRRMRPAALRPCGLRDELRVLSGLTGVRARSLLWPVAAGTLTLVASLTLTVVSAWLITRAWERPPVLDLTVAVTAVRALGISRAAFRYLDRIVGHDLALRAVARARVRVYEHLAALPGGTLAGLDRGALLARAGKDVDALGDAVVRVLIPAGVAGATGVLTVAFLALLSPAAAALLAVGLLVSGVAAPWLAHRAATRVERERSAAGDAWSAALDAILSDRGELRVRGRSDEAVAEATRAARGLARADGLGARGAAGGAAAGVAGRVLSAAAIIGVAVVAADAHTAQWIGVLVLLPLAAFEATDALPGAATSWVVARGALARIRAMAAPGAGTPGSGTSDVTRDGGESGSAPGAEARAGAEATTGPGELVLDDLAWGREETGELGRRSERIPAGGRRTIVAPNGSGKSTLLLTLAGLLPPLAGRVLVDGEPILGPDPRVLYTAEDAHVFATTVRDNLALGAPTASDPDMDAVLRAVGLGAWLDGLPGGLDEVLVAGAASLSGGQRRRLLLARALLSPAPVLLLDEPTEHLDARGTEEILALLDGRPLPGARAERTVVLVRHDPGAWETAGTAGGERFGGLGAGPRDPAGRS